MKYIPKATTQTLFRAGLILKKNGPHLAFGAGLVGTVASTVMACRATLKLAEEMPQMKLELDAIRGASENSDEAEKKAAIAKVYGMNTYRVASLYAPSVIIGGVSISLLAGSHVAMTRRNASLTAAYVAVSQAYEEYRARIRDEHGHERELHVYHAAENKGTDKIPEIHADPNKWSPYARFFDETSRDWQNNPELNRIYIQVQQTYANDLLRSRGHLFLNEVYDMLGLERSKPGAVVGWIIGPDGDNFVDFGIFEARNSRFVNGLEPSILLDFNVDGVIYDKI